MRQQQERKTRQMHITEKKTARNGHKWVDGDKQGQLHIHGLKVY